MKDKSYNSILIICIISFLCLYFFRRILFTPQDIILGLGIPTDLIEIYLPYKQFIYNSLRDHTIPLWNPYLFCGIPFLATPETALFYPLHAIFLILPLSKAYNYSIILHFILAGIFTFYYARYIGLKLFSSLISSFVFMFSSIFILHAAVGHLSNVTAMIWLPLILLNVEKLLRQEKIIYTLLIGIFLALQIFSGHLQYVLYSIIAIILYFLSFALFEKNIPRIKLAGLYILFALFICVIISAVQIIPSIELFLHSTRSIMKPTNASFFSLPPYNLITLIMPDFFGDIVNFPYWGRFYFWEMCLYIGILPLVLAIIASSYFKKNRYIIYFTSLTFVSIFFAIGYNIPLIRDVLIHVPILNLFRGHSKFIFLTAFALSVLCGFGIDITMRKREDKSCNSKKIAIFFAAAAICLICLRALLFTLDINLLIHPWQNILSKLATMNTDLQYDTSYFFNADFIKDSLARSSQAMARFIVLLSISLLCIAFLLTKKRNPFYAKIAISIFIMVDLWMFGEKYITFFRPTDANWNDKVVEFFNTDKQLFRIAHALSLTPNVPPEISNVNLGMNYQIASIGGYSAFLIREYVEFMSVANDFYARNPGNVVFFTNTSPLLDLLNLKYLLVNPKISVQDPTLELVFDDNRVKIYRNIKAFSRAFLVSEAKIVKRKSRALKELSLGSFDLGRYVILEEKPCVGSEENKADDYTDELDNKIKIVNYKPNEILINTLNNQPAYLVISDAYYPGWKVYVDGKLDKIYRANYFMRAVYLKEGAHSVKFIYDPLSFKIGFIITFFTIISIFFFLIKRRKTEV